ncbi:AMP-binding protein [Lutimonas halocynthiae]|uniref:AMP-binding protein n=1 Tax=Lutimonas halocynthiae TaxID=1446477 RepID=UPI0025B5E40D|nr:AMP-binding protein [Lutimonas halocynthiae]MDN3643626.1 AMP-binding protein [Lutimonas halocynthiae]
MKAKRLHIDFTWNGSSFASYEGFKGFIDLNYPELSEFIEEWFGEMGIIHMKTSGSTGKPKLIGLKRAHMINSAQTTASFFNLSSGSRVLLCLPLGYIAGRMMLVRAMVLGWQLDVVTPGSKPEFSNQVQYDFAAMVPLQLHNSLDSIEHIKTLIVGGGLVPNSLLEKIKKLPSRIFATYGMTETITHIAVSPLNLAAGAKESELVYQALPNVSFSVDDRSCLVIDADHVSDEVIITNDVVALHSETSFTWLARYDHVINSGGLKFFPELIEKKLDTLLKESFFISGLSDEVLGERIVMFVEGQKNDALIDRIKRHQKKYPEKLSKKEIPRDIYFLKSFQRTETDKIDRSTTVKLYLGAN